MLVALKQVMDGSEIALTDAYISAQKCVREHANVFVLVVFLVYSLDGRPMLFVRQWFKLSKIQVYVPNSINEYELSSFRCFPLELSLMLLNAGDISYRSLMEWMVKNITAVKTLPRYLS